MVKQVAGCLAARYDAGHGTSLKGMVAEVLSGRYFHCDDRQRRSQVLHRLNCQLFEREKGKGKVSHKLAKLITLSVSTGATGAATTHSKVQIILAFFST